MKTLFFILMTFVTFLCFPVFANQNAVVNAAANAAVVAMRAEYYDRFKDLPPSRTCSIDDGKDYWREIAAFEVRNSLAESEIKAENEKRYIAFGDYNRIFLGSSKSLLEKSVIANNLETSSYQYIITADGLLHIYNDGKFFSSLLCFISTDATKDYPSGLMMLAVAVEKDKPLSIVLYETMK